MIFLEYLYGNQLPEINCNLLRYLNIDSHMNFSVLYAKLFLNSQNLCSYFVLYYENNHGQASVPTTASGLRRFPMGSQVLVGLQGVNACNHRFSGSCTGRFPPA